MVSEGDFTGNSEALRPVRLLLGSAWRAKRNLACPFHPQEEIQVPPGTAEFAVSYRLQPKCLLLLQQLQNLHILNFLQLSRS